MFYLFLASFENVPSWPHELTVGSSWEQLGVPVVEVVFIPSVFVRFRSDGTLVVAFLGGVSRLIRARRLSVAP